MKKLFVYGDSISKGVLSVGHGYHLCENHDLKFLEEKGFEPEIHAKMGATITDGLRQLEDCECSPGDLVLMSYGGNDCDYNWQAISDHPEDTHLPKTPQDVFVTAFRNSVSSIRDKNAVPVFCSLVPLNADRYLDTICKGRSRESILQWLGDKEHLYRWQEYYSLLITSLCHSFGCCLIDLRSAFLLDAHFPSLIGQDGIHPTQEGYDRIHKTIQDSLLWM